MAVYTRCIYFQYSNLKGVFSHPKLAGIVTCLSEVTQPPLLFMQGFVLVVAFAQRVQREYNQDPYQVNNR